MTEAEPRTAVARESAPMRAPVPYAPVPYAPGSGTDGRSALRRWWFPRVGVGRIAWLRMVLYLFVILDMHAFARDTLDKGHHPDLYRPLLIERLTHAPAPSVLDTRVLYVVLLVGCVLCAAQVLPRVPARVLGFVVALAFTWWVAIGMSDGKVDHDHLALTMAVWLLPTAPMTRPWRLFGGRLHASGFGYTSTDEASGWAVRCLQVAVIATYALSAWAKLRLAGYTLAWPSSAVLTWAVIRRPHVVGDFLLHYPWTLTAMQWIGFAMESCSVVVLWLRGRALALAAAAFIGFHAATFALLWIHFLPTVVCWLAFAPLERVPALVRDRREARRTEPAVS